MKIWESDGIYHLLLAKCEWVVWLEVSKKKSPKRECKVYIAVCSWLVLTIILTLNCLPFKLSGPLRTWQCWSWVQACAGVKYQWPMLVVGELTPPQAQSLIHWEPRLGNGPDRTGAGARTEEKWMELHCGEWKPSQRVQTTVSEIVRLSQDARYSLFRLHNINLKYLIFQINGALKWSKNSNYPSHLMIMKNLHWRYKHCDVASVGTPSSPWPRWHSGSALSSVLYCVLTKLVVITKSGDKIHHRVRDWRRYEDLNPKIRDSL